MRGFRQPGAEGRRGPWGPGLMALALLGQLQAHAAVHSDTFQVQALVTVPCTVSLQSLHFVRPAPQRLNCLPVRGILAPPNPIVRIGDGAQPALTLEF